MRYNLKVATVLVCAFAAMCVCMFVCACAEINVKRVYADSDSAYIEYKGEIEHIFTHELVFDTAKAFAPDNKLRHCFDKDHLTAKEYKALLNSLYERDYVLVGLDAALSGAPLKLPRGKKPIALSFDDMTYDTVNRGCIDKIILQNDSVCDYTAHAEPQVTRERENITILESFIAEHPDFSVNGGRATVCVNGYNGILGYRITPDCRVSQRYMQKEIVACKTLVNRLKALGYTFSSHTYYHKYFKSMTAEQVEKDCKMWKKYVAPVVGETRVLCYPAGEHNAKSAKNDIFKAYGFDTFLCVGSRVASQSELKDKSVKYIYRRPFDGTALRLYGKQYAHLVDTKAIYDGSRYRPFSYKGGY